MFTSLTSHILWNRSVFNPQLKEAGSVCRQSAGDCDLPEYCTGVSKDCPDDSFEMNGTPCNNKAPGYCYDGQCPTLLQHCWRLFGPGSLSTSTMLLFKVQLCSNSRYVPSSGTTLGSDVCFKLNTRGFPDSSCGRNRGVPIPCTKEYVFPSWPRPGPS